MQNLSIIACNHCIRCHRCTAGPVRGDLARKLQDLLPNKERHGSRPCCWQHATRRIWHTATRHRIHVSVGHTGLKHLNPLDVNIQQSFVNCQDNLLPNAATPCERPCKRIWGEQKTNWRLLPLLLLLLLPARVAPPQYYDHIPEGHTTPKTNLQTRPTSTLSTLQNQYIQQPDMYFQIVLMNVAQTNIIKYFNQCP